MRWLKQWTRKRDAWVERKRRFQKFFFEKNRESAGEEVPIAAGEPVPDADGLVSERSEKT